MLSTIAPPALYMSHGEYIHRHGDGIQYLIDQLVKKPTGNRAIISLIDMKDLIGSGDDPRPSALRESHRNEKQFHDEATDRLQREHRRIQERIDAMYMDKLDGRIDNEFFDRKAVEFRNEQSRLMRDIQAHQNANRSYIEEGVKLLELAHNAHALFESQPPLEKRKLLNFVLSNCTWKGGELTAAYRKPFDVLALAVKADQDVVATGRGQPSVFASSKLLK